MSVVLENRNVELVDLLFTRGSDPLVRLEARDRRSGLETLIQIFIGNRKIIRVDCYLAMLRAFLGIMVAKRY